MYNEAWMLHGSKRAAAEALGMKYTTFRDKLTKELKDKAAAIDPLVVTGISTFTGRDGEHIGEWVKKSLDRQLEKDAREAAVAALCASVAPVLPIAGPIAANAKLLTLYSFFDYHVGMLAWHREGGANWNLDIAYQTGVQAMQGLVHSSPDAEVGVVNIGGDFLHFDGLLPVTPTSGHIVDADNRFGKVVEVAIKLIRALVSLALTKHKRVILLIMEGNHDLSASLWLRKMFGALYEDEPRIDVYQRELPYYALEWGVNLLGFHHGHLKKNDDLPGLFAAMFREMWGRCPKVHIHTGHRHHKEEKDHNGARVTQWPTLAAMDAHSARHGYFTDRELTSLTYHMDVGQVGSNTISPEMLNA